MTVARERFGPNILDDDGDVRPAADADPSQTLPPDNAFLIGRDHTLPARRQLEAGRAQEAEWDAVEDKNPGVYVKHAQRYQDELDLLDIISGSNMRRGFATASEYDEDIHELYEENLPRVQAGAHENHKRLVNRDILDVYHAQELKDAGVGYPVDIDFDARTFMRNAYNKKYGGPENKNKRAQRRKELRAKLAALATAQKP